MFESFETFRTIIKRYQKKQTSFIGTDCAAKLRTPPFYAPQYRAATLSVHKILCESSKFFAAPHIVRSVRFVASRNSQLFRAVTRR
jgi:hypothetical protein